MTKIIYMAKRDLKKKSFSKNCQGQMLVAVMMMITTVIIMFGMTVSVGHLVQSKINLQNSIDLSAMTAASSQARHMNMVSVANYRIRALYKLFLLDAYVTQSRFSTNFQERIARSVSEDPVSDPLTTLIVCEIKEGFHPTIEGEQGGSESGDPCQHAGKNFKVNPLTFSLFPGIDAPYIALNAYLIQIVQKFKDSCGIWRGSNEAWVKNFAIKRAQNNTEEAYAEFLKVLNDFKLDLGGNNPQLTGPGGIAAKNTFSSNLLGSTKDSTDENSILFLNHFNERSLIESDFDKITKNVGLAYIESKWNDGCDIVPNDYGARGTAAPFTTGASKKEISPGSASGGKIVQVALLAQIQKSQILFWPQEIKPTLVAIAAAKPFGSRVGPPKKYLDLEASAQSRTGYGNVTLFPGDDATDITTGGMGRKNFLGYAYRNGLPAPGSGVNELRPKAQEDQEAQEDQGNLIQIAFSPTIFDGLFYSIFDSSNEDSNFYYPDFLNLKIPSNGMRDRGPDYMPDPYRWLAALPADQGMDKYFNKDAITSGWSPDGEGGEKRSGYQIKLLSIESACENSKLNPNKEQRLINLCDTGQATL
jgi:hypothetical protein